MVVPETESKIKILVFQNVETISYFQRFENLFLLKFIQNIEMTKDRRTTRSALTLYSKNFCDHILLDVEIQQKVQFEPGDRIQIIMRNNTLEINFQPQEEQLRLKQTSGSQDLNRTDIDNLIAKPTPQKLQIAITPNLLKQSGYQDLLRELILRYLAQCNRSFSTPRQKVFCENFCQSQNYKISYNTMKSNSKFLQIWTEVCQL